jgi:hypothetical protein
VFLFNVVYSEFGGVAVVDFFCKKRVLKQFVLQPTVPDWLVGPSGRQTQRSLNKLSRPGTMEQRNRQWQSCGRYTSAGPRDDFLGAHYCLVVCPAFLVRVIAMKDVKMVTK